MRLIFYLCQAMSIPNTVFLFRIVHWQNIKHILVHGLCSAQHPSHDPNYIHIGHQQLITDRHNHPVPLVGYGHLGEYIPFYFWGHSPMLYMIIHGYQGVRQYPQEDIVYVVVNSAHILAGDFQYVYTDQHAKRKVARFFTDPKDFGQLRWDVIRSKDWKNNEDDLRRRDFKQAEFLVRHHIPTSYIDRLFVKTEAKMKEIADIVRKLDLEIPVQVAREGKLYF